MSQLKRDVVLVNPKDGDMPYDYYATYENLGIAYLTASLRDNGISVAIVDAYARNMDYEEVLREIASYSPRLVGFTSTYRSYPEAVIIAESVKNIASGVHITIGGEHVTYAANEILNETTLFDSIVLGEGEVTIVELFKAISSGNDLASVQGLSYRKNGQIFKNNYCLPISDLDTIPFPARDTLDYCIENHKPGLIGILGSRGCAFNCSFCNANEFFSLGTKPSWRKRSPKNIVDELEYIYKNYYDKGLYKLIYFYDATFVYPNPSGRQWVREICEEIIKRDIHVTFEINCRADSFTGIDDDLVPLLKKAGLKSVFVGLESGSEDVLSHYNKKVSVNQNIYVMEILKRHGIQSTTNGFIMLNPFITLNGLKDSANFLLKVEQCTYWNLSQKIQLFPGINLTKDLKNMGLLLDTYKHTEVYAYKFKDPRVEVLAEALDFSREDIPTRENHLIRYVEILGSQLMDMVTNSDLLNDEEAEKLIKYKKSIDENRMEIFHHNLVFFAKAVDLALENWTTNGFLEIKRDYLEEMDSKLNKLNDNFEKFLKFLDFLVK
ncbi:B12-binding domain-containing radical SAM protein [Desulfosporosinus metallidurans]|uniref:Radical SAM domain protein n=1 Tax=Desulfosporosinus metallidurans TaxID=1888891 RepID=A0A1Q8QPY5_9FIRM|nr:radical SAM protein [Desulfosporosinus metallidurans]OLN29405.1 Radical SAM domain protein [Desulfosporosinus metallidurans]